VSETRLRRILYVEDDPDIQEVARIALSVVGDYDVEICSSGTEAIDAAGRVRPDVVLLDVMMPGMDGVSTMAALRGVPGFPNTASSAPSTSFPSRSTR
jgi:two-component system OmpR family response regulator